MWLKVILGIVIPFAGTALGSACVIFMKKELGRATQLITELDADWESYSGI